MSSSYNLKTPGLWTYYPFTLVFFPVVFCITSLSLKEPYKGKLFGHFFDIPHRNTCYSHFQVHHFQERQFGPCQIFYNFCRRVPLYLNRILVQYTAFLSYVLWSEEYIIFRIIDVCFISSFHQPTVMYLSHPRVNPHKSNWIPLVNRHNRWGLAYFRDLEINASYLH